MYPLPEFKERDRDAIVAFIEKYPFAMITAIGDDGKLVATHIPLMVHKTEPNLVFRGHIMRRTEHWNAIHAHPEVLVAFTGPDAPVLASWQSPAPFGGTWNYLAVHARGTATFLPEADLLDNLQTLKDYFEESPTHKFDSLPADYLARLVPAIECLEIQVTEVDSVYKLSQNRTLDEFDNTVENLRKRGGESALVAEEMVVRRASFFGIAE